MIASSRNLQTCSGRSLVRRHHGEPTSVYRVVPKLAPPSCPIAVSVRVRGGQKKWLLRRALRGIVPDAILDGPKTGFTVPYAEWLRGPLAEYMQQVLLDPSILEWDLVDRALLEQTISEHRSGKRNHGHILYKLLNLALWHNAYLRVPAATRT